MTTDRASRRGIFGWMLFDWANQPFHTLIITFIFAPYFAASVASDPVTGQAMWANTAKWTGLCVAILAPILGAIADQSGPRKPWIFAMSCLFVIGAFGLWGAVPGMENPTSVLLLFALAYFGAEFMMVFYNAMLPGLAPKEEIGRISGSGWALGYVGGVLVLLIVLLFLAPAGDKPTTLLGISPIFGLDASAGEPARITGPLSAIWLIIFAIPMFLFTPDAPRVKNAGGAIGKGLRGVTRTLKNLPKTPSLMMYLIASMVYRDALAGVFIFGGIYAAGVLDWQTFDLGIFGIIAAIAGALGAWLGGRADEKFGPRPVIVVSILILIAVCITVLTTNRASVLFMPIAEGSGLPDIVFYVCGALIGATGGALQAASRTLLVHQADGKVPMTEAFGLYALSGKATAFIAPTLIAYFTLKTGDQALGIAPVIGLFALGLVLLYWVKTTPEADHVQSRS